MATSLEAGLRHDRTRSEEFHELQASSTEPKSSDHFIEVVKETKDLDASQDWEETPLKCDDGGKRDDGLENDEGLDGGWGWVIVASCSFMSMLVTSLSLTFGIQFGDLLISMGVSSTLSGWVFNSHAFIWCLMPSITGPFCRRFTSRKVALVISFFLSMCFLGLGFVTAPWQIFLLYGIGCGIGGGVLINITFLMPPLYFKKRRGLALGLVSVAIGLGQIISPLVIRALITNYGYTGAILLETGITLHSCLAAALLRPLRSRKKPKEIGADSQGWFSDPLFADLKSNMLQCFAGFKSSNVMVYCIADSFSLAGTLNFFMVLPFAIHSWGYSFDVAAFALSSMAMSGFVSRIVTSLMVDKKWFDVSKVYTMALLLMGISSLCINLASNDQTLILIVAVVTGIFLGAGNSLKQILLIETVGMENYVPAMGTAGFVRSVCFIGVGPLVGFIRDQLSSYTASLCLSSAMVLLCPVLWILKITRDSCAKNRTA